MTLDERTFSFREYFVLTVSALMNCFFLYESIQIFMKKPGADAPGTFPLILSCLMVLLNVFLFAEAHHRIPKCTEKFPSVLSALAASVKAELPVNVVVTFAATIVYVVLMSAVGFVVSTLVFLVGLTVYLDRKKWAVALVSSAVITAAIYVVFGLIFRVRL